MKTAVFYGKEDYRVEERPVFAMGEGDVKIRVALSGICGSELHEYAHGPILFCTADSIDPATGKPVTYCNTGHEFSGIVEETGSLVTRVKVGDRVTANPLLGATGSHAEFIVVPESSVYKLPASVSLAEGALVEATATGLQAVKNSGLVIGDSVVVFGAGPIGLAVAACAKAAGAATIISVDISDDRLETAQKMGASHVVNAGQADALAVIKEILPNGADVVFEAAGAAATYKQAIQAGKKGGRVVIIAVYTQEVGWNPFDLAVTGVTMVGSYAYTPETFQRAIDLMATGQLKMNPMITGCIQLKDIVAKGFEALIKDKSHAKILVELSARK